MGNRVMAAKALKDKRQRRAWAKSLGYKGGFTPNREVIKSYKLHARGLEDADFVDSVVNSVAPYLRGQRDKKEKLAAQGAIEAWLPDDCILKSTGPGPENQYERWLTYSNSRKDCLVVVHMDLHNGIERRSSTFSSRDYVMLAWELDAIKWVYKKPIA